MSEGAGDDTIHKTAQCPGDVGDAFSLSQPDLGGRQVDGMAAELPHGYLEADARAQRGLLKEKRRGLPLQECACLPAAFEESSTLDEMLDFFRGEIGY